MEESILKSTKKKLNVSADDLSFDIDIIDHINAAFSHLQQLGIGPEEGFVIEDDTSVWNDFIDGPTPVLSALKINIHLRVRSIFDPPTMPHVMTAMQQQLQESDTRLLVMRETTDWVDPMPPEDELVNDDA